MEFLKYRRNLFKKYYFDYSKYAKEVETNFSDVQTEFWDNSNARRNMIDNQPNIRVPNPANVENNGWDFYSTLSKHADFVDPTCNDNTSIQYAGEHRVYLIFKNKITNQWEFPTIPLMSGDSFKLNKIKLHLHISKDNYAIRYMGSAPTGAITREFYNHETEDPKNEWIKGIFYNKQKIFKNIFKI